MALTLNNLLRRIQCLCKRLEDLEIAVGDLEGGAALPLFTEGSVLFADTDGSITEDNTRLFYDSSNGFLGVGTNVPSYRLHVVGNTSLGSVNATAGFESALRITQQWNDAVVIPETLSITATDVLSPSTALLIQAKVGATSMFNVRKDGRITTAETLAFTNNLTQQTTPTGFLTLSAAMNGTVQYSTVGDLQTALGIGAGALTAGYVAYGTGTGITGEAEFFYDTTNNRLGIGTSTPSTSLHISAGAANGVITLESDNSSFMSIYRYSNNVTRPRYETYKARGTKAVPLTVQTGDELAAFDFYGHNGSAFQRNATIYTTVRNVSGTNITAQMNFGFGFSRAATDYYQAFSAAGALFTNTTATSKTPTSIVDINRDNLGAVQTTSSGLALTNNTAATAVTPVQVSPAVRFSGSRWNTTTVAAQAVSVIQDFLPATGATTGVSHGTWRLLYDYTTPGTYTEVLGVQMFGGSSRLKLTGNAFEFSSGGGSTITSNYSMYMTPGTAASGVAYGVRIGTVSSGAATAKLNIDGQTITATAGTNLGVLDMTQTWSVANGSAATAIKLSVTDTASHSSNLLMDLLAGASGTTSMFSVDKTGAVITAGSLTIDGAFRTLAASASNSSFYVAGSSGGSANGGLGLAGSGSSGVRVQINGSASITASANNSSANLILGGTVQVMSASGTHPVFANLAVKPTSITSGASTLSNAATVYIEGPATGTGIPANNYSLWVDDGVSKFDGVIRLRGYTVATLPTGVVGDVAYVTDALAPAYNTAVTGGGAVTIKVFYNGTNWMT